MHAVGVEFHLIGMTDAAVDRCRDRLTGSEEGGTDLGVALRAGGSRMARTVVGLFIHEERYGLALPDHAEIEVAVTAQTVPVRGSGLIKDPPDLVG